MPDSLKEEDKWYNMDRRRHNNLRDWAVLITLALNLAGLVWTAAKWSAAIEQLQATTARTNATMDIVVSKLSTMDTRTTLLEFQVNKNSGAIERKP